MARGKSAVPKVEDKEDDVGGIYKKPDAASAFKILDNEIKPRLAFIAEKRGDLSDPYKRIKDDCNYPRDVLDFIGRLDGMEDAKRDHVMMALHLGLEYRNYRRPLDLVSMAEGATANDPIVQAGARERPKLVTVSDGFDDGELAAAAGEAPADLKLN